MSRPAVDVVVPFRGPVGELAALRDRVSRLELRTGDSALIVDNTPERGRGDLPGGTVPVIHAADVATPGYARNRGAERGSAEWLVFFDADTVAPPDLLDRYFDPLPAAQTALLAGGVADEDVPPDAPAVPRYAYLRRVMHQNHTLGFGSWGFAQTANVACRREAFDAVNGFREDIRACEDADLTYRLRAGGWKLERRERAMVVHRSRQTVRGFVAQRLTHGAGIGWLHRRYPGSWPPRRRLGLVWWGMRHAVSGLVGAARMRSRDAALCAVLDPLEQIALELGRSLPNRRPLSARAMLTR